MLQTVTNTSGLWMIAPNRTSLLFLLFTVKGIKGWVQGQ